MRIRKLVAAGLLAGSVLFVAAQPAHAEDPGKKSGKELAECLESALKDTTAQRAKGDYSTFNNDVDNCRKAKSLLTPAVSEIIWGGIAFAIVAFLLMKFGFPAIKKSLKAREDRIRDDLESASQAKDEAEADLAQYRTQLGNARSEATQIIEDARQAAEQVRRDLVAKAEGDAAEIRSRAQEDIRLAQDRAMADLRAQVSELSIELAEKVVERNLDRDTQVALIENYINSVGNGRR
jgi:F-type H+-transporting ATPase subunit b